MEVYRIAQERYIKDLSGLGASIHGGRWNEKGTPMLYCSQCRSLAVLEIIVNTSAIWLAPKDLQIATIKIPDDTKINHFAIGDLPNHWRHYPYPNALQKLGTKWAMMGECQLLKVPSSIIPQEYNILINPNHPDWNYLEIINIEKFVFNPRLLKQP
jgi:RES domain-containing protein